MLLPANGLLRHVYCDLQDESARITRYFPNRFAKDSLLAASISAVAGVIEAQRQREAAPVRMAPPVLLLRCWQKGRLLFEEPPTSAPPEAR